MVRRMVCMVEKKSKCIKSVFCTTDSFFSRFLRFSREKKFGEKSLPYVAPYMLRRMICMVKIFDILQQLA